MSLDFYRFSISWSRLLPNGFPNHVSEDGKRYYNKLIDGLLAKGIEPVVTIYHWDLPQRLQDLGGWTNSLITDWFVDYADVVFALFGDRVKTWITINEPLIFCDASYSKSLLMAPGVNDSEVGMYLCGKNVLLAHAKAYRLYQKKYKARFHGLLSFANQASWFEGLTAADEELAELANQYTVGRHSHPVYSKEGGWPPVIEKLISEKSAKEGFFQSRLPPFTNEEKELVRGTFDFYALNHYTSRTVRMKRPGELVAGFPMRGVPELDLILEGRPEWPVATSEWLFVYPQGLRQILRWIKKHYGDIPIFITENGYSSVGGNLEDQDRLQYYKGYLEQVLLAMKEDGVNVIGYTAWSLIDNFEWMDGYRSKFGLCEVDFSDPLRTRTLRRSAHFYAEVIRRRSLDIGPEYNDEL
ncbi:hypothetical protein ABMA28_009205 [Loxostege sticticalis]|uniref:Myrosinase 1-like n=2 Tax=Loxostege sticticalis TaxID=481309 RepID=A0ABD0SCK1_LOXSC